MKYVRVTPIEAERFDGSKEMIKKFSINDELVDFIGGDQHLPVDHQFQIIFNYSISTLEGQMYFGIGDYIATGIDGEHWPIEKSVFERTYRPVEDGDEK
ncbi:hypothetical protein [Furfurilactobacillus cerevisiae]|uniref:hypothetical protein n=1 Tax=Furfurilactobacillus rossiae TaxID=231049 RepID=UPI003B97F6C3